MYDLEPSVDRGMLEIDWYNCSSSLCSTPLQMIKYRVGFAPAGQQAGNSLSEPDGP